MKLVTFDQWRAEYAGYDWPSLKAEVETLTTFGEFNRIAAMFERLVEVACDAPVLEHEHRVAAAKLADSIAWDLRSMISTSEAASARFEQAFDATLARAVKFSRFPRYAGFIQGVD